MIARKQELTQRQINALETKDKLFKAAIKLFSKYGYEKVTIDDIVNHCGISKGSFYTHFKSKEHVMFEQFKLIDLNYEQWFLNFNPGDNITTQLLSFIDCVMNYSFQSLGLDILKVVFSSQISLASRLPKLLSDETRPYFKIVRTIIRAGQEKNEFRNDTSEIELARLITQWVRSEVYEWCLFDGQFNLVERSKEKFVFLTAMLATTKENI